MTIADKLQAIADNTQRVFDAGYLEGQEAGGYSEGFDAGKKAQHDAFWDAYQMGGNRTNYNGAFYGDGWNEQSFRPKHNIKPSRADYMFKTFTAFQGDLVAHLASLGVTLDFSNCNNFNETFIYCYINRVGEIDTRNASSLSSMFANSRIVTVDKLILKDEGGQTFSYTFSGCTYLENIAVSGMITKDFDIRWATNLTKRSILSILSAADMSVGTNVPRFVVTLSRAAVNKAFETTEGANDGEESWEWQSQVSNTESYYTTTLV